jgi:hypothetical protein
MSTIIENLHAMRLQIDAMIAAASKDGSGAMPMTAVKKPKAEKAPRANAGMPTLHGAWTTHVLKEHNTESLEFKEFLAERIASARRGELLYNDGHAKVKSGKKTAGDAMDEKEAAVGAHTVFVSYWKAQHAEEHAAFKAEWEAANPKESRVASSKSSQASASDSEDGEGAAKPAPKKRGAKKHADMTPEELAADKAKRAAKKAEKTAKKAAEEAEERESANMEPAESTQSPMVGGGASPALTEAAEEADADDEPEYTLKPFTHKKITYLRLGCIEDGDVTWMDGGDLWKVGADGKKGDYAGIFLANGKIDSSPQVLANPPEID